MRSSSSAMMRDLPMPGSPETSTTWPWAALARAQRRKSRSISSSRPTNRVSADIAVFEEFADQPSRARSDDDRVRLGQGLQPGGEVRRFADDRLFLRRALADQIAHHHQPGGDPDARLQPGRLDIETSTRVDQSQPRPDRPLGVVLMSARVAEIDEHAVAHILGDKPVEPWDEVPDNVLVDTFFGDAAATERAFAIADHIVEMEFHVGRVTGVPMEPRAALGHWDAATGRGTLWAGSGGAVRQKTELAEVLGIPPDSVRVLSLDVGGNFGTRNRLYVESGLVLWASRRLGRPVKYTSTRSEVFLTDFQGRDLLTRVALAIRADGKFLGLRADNVSNVGARCVSLSPLGKGSALVTGSYDIPAATLRSRAVFTNTM